MTNTKWLRRALLGGAALGVLATGAHADELSALKDQLAALQSRVSQLESTPADLPAGAKIITVRKGQLSYNEILPIRASEQLRDHQGYTIAVTPTADMPAPVSEVTVSGEIRARLLFNDESVNNDDDDVTVAGANGGIDLDGDGDLAEPSNALGFDTDNLDVTTRGRLRIDGKTETAIGEVGGTIRLQGVDGGSPLMNIIWGYWQMTPNLQLGGGYTDSLAAIQAGVDWNGNAVLNGFNAGPTNQSVSQFRLTYSDGGLSLAASLESNDNGDIPAVAGNIGFDTGSFLITASAIWEEDDTTGFIDTDDNWMVGGGVIGHLGDMLRVEVAGNMGEGYSSGTYGVQSSLENDMGYWGANALGVVSFANNMSLELDFGYTSLDHEGDEMTVAQLDDQVDNLWSAGAALYWDPVDQLTLGWGAGWNEQSDNDGTDYTDITAGFGAWFRF
jgi:hypothetical protein